jgi:hypothetical protein
MSMLNEHLLVYLVALEVEAEADDLVLVLALAHHCAPFPGRRVLPINMVSAPQGLHRIHCQRHSVHALVETITSV